MADWLKTTGWGVYVWVQGEPCDSGAVHCPTPCPRALVRLCPLPKGLPATQHAKNPQMDQIWLLDRVSITSSSLVVVLGEKKDFF